MILGISLSKLFLLLKILGCNNNIRSGRLKVPSGVQNLIVIIDVAPPPRGVDVVPRDDRVVIPVLGVVEGMLDVSEEHVVHDRVVPADRVRIHAVHLHVRDGRKAHRAEVHLDRPSKQPHDRDIEVRNAGRLNEIVNEVDRLRVKNVQVFPALVMLFVEAIQAKHVVVHGSVDDGEAEDVLPRVEDKPLEPHPHRALEARDIISPIKKPPRQRNGR